MKTQKTIFALAMLCSFYTVQAGVGSSSPKEEESHLVYNANTINTIMTERITNSMRSIKLFDADKKRIAELAKNIANFNENPPADTWTEYFFGKKEIEVKKITKKMIKKLRKEYPGIKVNAEINSGLTALLNDLDLRVRDRVSFVEIAAKGRVYETKRK